MNRSRKCSLINHGHFRLTQRHLLMLDALAQHKAMTRQQLTVLFFGSSRNCALHLRHLRRRALIREVAALPSSPYGSTPLVYVLTPAGARVVATDSGEARRLSNQVRRTGGSYLHLRHTIAVNEYFTTLLAAVRVCGGALQWLSESACREHYTDVRGGRPHLTPDGAGTLRLPSVEALFYLELDRGTERRAWLWQKFRRYVAYLAGHRGADALHVLFVVPDSRRERVIHEVGRAALRGAATPCPCLWTANQELLTAEGSLGAVWARIPGKWIPRVGLEEIGRCQQPPPSVSLSGRDVTADVDVEAA